MTTSTSSATSTPRGRPRSERARKAVLDAALALIEKEGYPATSIEAISARSGVAKTTIYRWWPNRAALVVELLMGIASRVAPPPSGDDPLRAIRTELGDVAKATDALPGRILGALVGEAQHDAELRDALLHGLFTPRRMETASVVRRAQEAGVIRPDVSPTVAVDLLFGPIFFRGMLRREPVTPGFVGEVFDTALRGLAERATSKRSRSASARSRPKSRRRA